MDAPTKTPGILTLDLTSSVNQINCQLQIPRQILLLQNVRIEFSTGTPPGLLYIDLPFLSPNQLIDNNIGRYLLPIFVGPNLITVQNTLQLPINMSKHLDERFTVNIYDQTFALVQNLSRLTLQFSYEYGHI